MLTILAIGAIIATSNAAIPIYSEDEIKIYNNAMLPMAATTADSINLNLEMKFQKVYAPELGEIVLISVSLPHPTPAKKHDVCGIFLGIELNGGDNHLCNITLIRVQDERNDDEPLILVLFFVADGRAPAQVDVPIFERPPSAQLHSANQEDLEKWADEEKVGLISPFDSKNLDGIEKRPVAFDFKWLNKLLQYKIRESGVIQHYSGMNMDFNRYLASPLVLSKEEINKILAVFSSEEGVTIPY